MPAGHSSTKGKIRSASRGKSASAECGHPLQRQAQIGFCLCVSLCCAAAGSSAFNHCVSIVVVVVVVVDVVDHLYSVLI